MFTSAGPGRKRPPSWPGWPRPWPRGRRRVLAIDGNLRAAELAARLGVQSSRRPGGVLAGTASWNDAVRPTVMRGLSVLPGGIVAGRQSAGFEPSALGPLLAEFRKHYRLVLVEAASLLYAETAPLAAWCDGAYLVVRLGWTTRRADRGGGRRHPAVSGPIARLHRGGLNAAAGTGPAATSFF